MAPLVIPERDDPKALRFDMLMYGIELAFLIGKKYTKARKDLRRKVRAVAGVSNIPEIMAQNELINRILQSDYLETAGINEFENIQENIRNLIKYIPVEHTTYFTNFDDEILSMDWNEADLESDDLKNYKAKAEFYVRQHAHDILFPGYGPLEAKPIQGRGGKFAARPQLVAAFFALPALVKDQRAGGFSRGSHAIGEFFVLYRLDLEAVFPHRSVPDRSRIARAVMSISEKSVPAFSMAYGTAPMAL